MLQTLFYIPRTAFDLPMFGFGILLLVWAFASGALLTWLVRKQGWNADTKGYIPVLGLIGAAIFFLLPALAEEKGLPIRGYGTMVLLGVASGIWLSARRAIRANLDPELILSLAFWMFLAGMFGARTFYVMEYWKQQFLKVSSDGSIDVGATLAAVSNIAQGGLVVFGAFIGATIAFLVFARQKRLPVLGTFDLIAPSMILGLAIGRIGCFMNGCCYGGTCSLPWAVSFPWNSPPHVRQVAEGQVDLHGLFLAKDQEGKPRIEIVVPGSDAERAGLKAGAVIRTIGNQTPGRDITSEWKTVRTVREAQAELLRLNTPGIKLFIQTDAQEQPTSWTIAAPLAGSRPVHPAQLYASLDAFALFLFLLAWYPYRRHDGELLAWMLVIHAVSRFMLEVIRTDEGAVFGTGWTISQNLSLLMLLAGVGLWAYLLFFQRPRTLNFYALAGN